MRQQLFNPMILLLLCCQALYAEEPIAPPQPKLATEVLRDPTAITEKMGQGLEGLALPAVKNAPSPGGSINKGELKDPTLMYQNFRDALNRVTQNKTGTVANGPGVGIAPAAPVLPKISLLASVCGGNKDKSSAMLRINDKTEMVYVDDKITFLDKNQVIEIRILDIHKHYVKVMVLPAHEEIILR